MQKTKTTILEPVHDTAMGLHAAGVMDQVTLYEFDRFSVPRLPEHEAPATFDRKRALAAMKQIKGMPKGNRREKNGRVVKSLKMKNPPHPGFVVRMDCLLPHGLSVTEGAKILGVSRSALSRLVNESADLSWKMAIRVAKTFGGTPEGWMRLQCQYEATQVKAQ